MSIIGFSSECSIIDNKRVLKKYRKSLVSLGLFANELKWYKRFHDNPYVYKHTPKLYDYSGDTIVLQYAGMPISAETIPEDFKEQLREIAAFLKFHHCQHCDVIPSNVLVLNKRIYLIDFGWAIEMGQNPYQVWRQFDWETINSLNYGYRAADWPNDKYALTQIYRKYTGKTNERLFFNIK